VLALLVHDLLQLNEKSITEYKIMAGLLNIDIIKLICALRDHHLN